MAPKLLATTAGLTKSAEEFVEKELAEGERVTATLAHATSGRSPWLMVFGSIAAMVGSTA